MTNKKLFDDMFQEALAGKIRLADVLKGDEPLKKICKDVSKHFDNIIALHAYGDADNGN